MKQIKKELVFDQNYLPFNVCHASNICILPDEDLLAAWFAGTKEGANDTAIWIARCSNGVWKEPVKISDNTNEPHWNPVLFQLNNYTLFLFYKIGKNISKWSTLFRVSHDEGRTWSAPKELVKDDRGGRGPVRNKLIELSNGSIIAGSSTEQGIWRSFADKSEDGGKTWKKSNPIFIEGIEYNGEKTVYSSDIEVSEQSFYGRGVIQPAIWESKPGRIHMLLRSTEGLIYKSDSIDYGKTWGKAYPTALPNNNSGIDVVRMKNGTLVLCYNPVGINWGPRTPLSLALSHDNGNTWSNSLILEDKPGEFSYPSIVASGENIYVSYTYNRKSIMVAHLKLTKEDTNE